MEDRPMQGMWGRYALFIVLALLILVANMWLMSWLAPPRPAEEVAKAQRAAEEANEPVEPADAPAKEQPAGEETQKPAPDDAQPALANNKAAEQPQEFPRQWLALGSIDPNGPFRFGATVDSQGAAVSRIELSSDNFHDLEWEGGYMGHVTMDPLAAGDGAPVQVVTPGSPAEQAGLQVGDVITAFGKQNIRGFADLEQATRKGDPGDTIELTVRRGDKTLKLPLTLRRRPLEVVRPEGQDPTSLLMTLSRLDDQELGDIDLDDSELDDAKEKPRPAGLSRELKGVDLRRANWEVVKHSQTEVVFRRPIAGSGLEVFKTYRLVAVPDEARKEANHPAYHLEFEIEVRNAGEAPHKLAYLLDGPTGLPTEGYWFASKVGSSGLRDVVVSLGGRQPVLVSGNDIANGDWGSVWKGEPVSFVGVDAQYFSAVLIPQREDPQSNLFEESRPIRVGPVDPQWKKLVNVTFRVESVTHEIAPGSALVQKFTLFAGPKKPDLLARYGLGGIINYGWFWWVAIPMLWILHGFYAVVRNYGIAIVLLTVLVRLSMFPLSRKQALSAQKMQELAPEIKKIQEKHKGNAEAKMRAQQELFRKHNYNPLAGCLPLFFQLPIFIGLYRSLMVDVELRQAPLISEAIRWCSNLAAPDKLFNWSWLMPEFITSGRGMFGLGPYFNVLPLVAVAIFLWQQKMFMPPPTDEQSAMQQTMMKYMMVFMGVLFYKVAAGLCIYFIASSLWSIAERKLLPKSHPPAAGAPPAPARSSLADLFSGRNGDKDSQRRAAVDRKKLRKGR